MALPVDHYFLNPLGNKIASDMDDKRMADSLPNPPRLRASLASSLTLTNVWQTVMFKKTGTYDVDTFPTPRLDVVLSKLIASTTDANDHQYDLEFFYKLTAPLVPVHDTQLRFMIPATTPIYFPFPDGDGLINIGSVNVSPFRSVHKQILYYNSMVRANGIFLQMRTATLSLNQPVLVDAALSLFPR